MLALVQSFIHLYYDYDRVHLSLIKSRLQSKSLHGSHLVNPPLQYLRNKVPGLLQSSAIRAVIMSVLGPMIYALFLRQTLWSWTMYTTQIMWSINKNSQPSRLPPYHISLIIRSATSGFFLTLLWEASSAIFEVYVAQAPLKKGDPLTNDSRDPNGSLLNGLKSKKETTRVDRTHDRSPHIPPAYMCLRPLPSGN